MFSQKVSRTDEKIINSINEYKSENSEWFKVTLKKYITDKEFEEFRISNLKNYRFKNLIHDNTVFTSKIIGFDCKIIKKIAITLKSKKESNLYILPTGLYHKNKTFLKEFYTIETISKDKCKIYSHQINYKGELINSSKNGYEVNIMSNVKNCLDSINYKVNINNKFDENITVHLEYKKEGYIFKDLLKTNDYNLSGWGVEIKNVNGEYATISFKEDILLPNSEDIYIHRGRILKNEFVINNNSDLFIFQEIINNKFENIQNYKGYTNSTIDNILSKSISFICENDILSDSFNFFNLDGKFNISKETKNKIYSYYINKEYSQKGIYFEDLQKSIEENDFFPLKYLSIKEIYDMTKHPEIDNYDKYKNYIKYYPNEVYNQKLNENIYNIYMPNKEMLNKLINLNPEIEKSNADELTSFKNIKDGVDAKKFIERFQNPLKTKKCKTNQYYDGQLLNGFANGNGKSINKNQLYIGEFNNGKYNGNGKLFLLNGKLIYEGNFTNGKINGLGEFFKKPSYGFTNFTLTHVAIGDTEIKNIKNAFLHDLPKCRIIGGQILNSKFYLYVSFYGISSSYDDTFELDKHQFILNDKKTNASIYGKLICPQSGTGTIRNKETDFCAKIEFNNLNLDNPYSFEFGFIKRSGINPEGFFSNTQDLYFIDNDNIIKNELEVFKKNDIIVKPVESFSSNDSSSKACKIKLIDWNENDNWARFELDAYTKVKITWKYEDNSYYIKDDGGNSGYFRLKDNSVQFGVGFGSEDLGKASSLQNAIEKIVKRAYCR